jgi:formate hydrogenlyase subunit 3/multisubunit Na+/H+ antiporter MnhD subunit
MKSRVIQTLKSPRWLAFFISFGMMAVGGLGIYACAYLDHRFPEPYHNMNFFGHFDGLAVLFFFIFGIGMFCSAIWCLGFLIAAIISLFRRRHPKQI